MYRSSKTGLEFENISFVDGIFNNQMEMKNCYVDDNPHFPLTSVLDPWAKGGKDGLLFFLTIWA